MGPTGCPETSVTINISCVTPQKSENLFDVIYKIPGFDRSAFPRRLKTGRIPSYIPSPSRVCMYVCTCVCVCVCVYVCMYVPMYVCMYVSMYVRMYVCTYVCMYYVCMYVCMYVRTYVCMYLCMYVLRMYVRTYVCMHVCMYELNAGLPILADTPSCPLTPLLQPFKFSAVLQCHSFINSYPISTDLQIFYFPRFISQ